MGSGQELCGPPAPRWGVHGRYPRPLDEGFSKVTATTCKKIIEQVQKLEEQYRQLERKFYDEEQENSVSSDEESSGESGTDVDSEEPTE